MQIHRRSLFGLALAIACFSSTAHPEKPFIIVQSTTSTQDTGLFDYLLPKFTEKSGIEVRVVAVGTGQALKNAQNGDGDVVLVHSKPDEEKFVADGWGVKRDDVMYNDFVIVGPAADPAKISGVKDAAQALKQIAEAKAPFASRADDSGTNKAELRLWRDSGIDAKSTAAPGISKPARAWAPPSTAVPPCEGMSISTGPITTGLRRPSRSRLLQLSAATEEIMGCRDRTSPQQGAEGAAACTGPISICEYRRAR